MLTGYLDPSNRMRILVSDRPKPTTFAVVARLRGIRCLPSSLKRTRSPIRKYSSSADIVLPTTFVHWFDNPDQRFDCVNDITIGIRIFARW